MKAKMSKTPKTKASKAPRASVKTTKNLKAPKAPKGAGAKSPIYQGAKVPAPASGFGNVKHMPLPVGPGR